MTHLKHNFLLYKLIVVMHYYIYIHVYICIYLYIFLLIICLNPVLVLSIFKILHKYVFLFWVYFVYQYNNAFQCKQMFVLSIQML